MIGWLFILFFCSILDHSASVWGKIKMDEAEYFRGETEDRTTFVEMRGEGLWGRSMEGSIFK